MDTGDAEIHTGSTILGCSAEVIGTIDVVYHDNQSGRCRWAQVSIRGHRRLVPLSMARVEGNTVWVPVTAEQVASAPHQDPATALTVDDEHDLDRHYAMTNLEPPFVVSVAQQPSSHRRAATTDRATTGPATPNGTAPSGQRPHPTPVTPHPTTSPAVRARRTALLTMGGSSCMNELHRIENVEPPTTPRPTIETSTPVTVLRIPTDRADGPVEGLGDLTVDGDGIRMRALWRHQATVVSIGGTVDALTGDRMRAFATRFVLAGNALVLDMTGVEFLSARGISILVAVDDACRAAEVPWALIPSPFVTRVLRLTGCDTTLPAAGSLPEAIRQVTALTHARQRIALATTTGQRHAV